MTIEANWHDDGHVMHLELVQSEAQITSVHCPGGECMHLDTPCVVRHFLGIYGLECNVGVADMTADMPIAWTLIGNPRDLDACQLWVMPTDDVMFKAWVSPG